MQQTRFLCVSRSASRDLSAAHHWVLVNGIVIATNGRSPFSIAERPRHESSAPLRSRWTVLINLVNSATATGNAAS
jgi:hypothetical protein